jgi:hypothetical protein
MVRQKKAPLTLTYINIRKIIGILAMTLPIVIFLAGQVLFLVELQPSISAYYYTEMRWFFVLTLCSIGFFLFFYQGYSDREKWLAKIAGIAAFSTAIFPTEPVKDKIACISPLTIFPNAGDNICSITSNIHLLSAATMFLIVAYFSFFEFTKSEGTKSGEKIFRNKIYRGCGFLIFLVILALGLNMLIYPRQGSPIENILYPTYWSELIALLAFGVTWAVKGETLWKDATPSYDREKFSTLQDQQVKGYKDGMGVFVFLVALLFTMLLYSAQIAPFNLFTDESRNTTGSDTGTVTNAPSVIPTATEASAKFQILNPDALGVLTYKDSSKPEVELTIANNSPDPINLKFYTFFEQPCKKETLEKCVQITPVSTDSKSTDNQISGNEQKSFKFSFQNEDISGNIIIVVGETISKIPFNITSDKTTSEKGQASAGEAPILGFYKTEAQQILMGILFCLVVVVIYFILNNQVLSLFWPLVRRKFRIDLTDDNTGEKKELWSLFSNQANEMGVSPGFSVNPRADSGISTPSTLAPDNSYLKTFFDILNWIFPQMGYTLRLQKMSSKELGAGLSLAIVKNDRKENIEEKVFWTADFGLQKEDAQKSDLNSYRLLMIPAYFWFSDAVDRMDGFETAPQAWEANAYYHLGDALWHSDREKGINFYTNSINLDPENWSAYAALGRLWIEKSQEEKLKDIAKEYLLLAINYLNIAIDGLKKGNVDRVYFGALYNKIVALFYWLDLENMNMDDLLLEGFKYKQESLNALSIVQKNLDERTSKIEISSDGASTNTSSVGSGEGGFINKLQNIKNSCKSLGDQISYSALHENLLELYDDDLFEKILNLIEKLLELIKVHLKIPVDSLIKKLLIKKQDDVIKKIDRLKSAGGASEHFEEAINCVREIYHNPDNTKIVIKNLKKLSSANLCVREQLKNADKKEIKKFLERLDGCLVRTQNDIDMLKKDPFGSWLINFLPAFEFVLLILELETEEFVELVKLIDPSKKVGTSIDKNGLELWLNSAIEQFKHLPYNDDPIDMNQPLLPDEQKKRRHFTRTHYRAQFNAACFYSRLKLKADEAKIAKADCSIYADLALDHLEMALSVGDGLEKFAKHDSSLNPIHKYARYKKITKSEEVPKLQEPQKPEINESKLHLYHFIGRARKRININM